MRSTIYTCVDPCLVCVHLDCNQFGRKWHSTEFGVSKAEMLSQRHTTEQCQGCICFAVVPMLGIT